MKMYAAVTPDCFYFLREEGSVQFNGNFRMKLFRDELSASLGLPYNKVLLELDLKDNEFDRTSTGDGYVKEIKYSQVISYQEVKGLGREVRSVY